MSLPETCTLHLHDANMVTASAQQFEALQLCRVGAICHTRSYGVHLLIALVGICYNNTLELKAIGGLLQVKCADPSGVAEVACIACTRTKP